MRHIFLALGIAFLLVGGAIFLIPDPVYAQTGGLVPCDGPECQVCHVVELAQNILNFFARVAFILAALMFAVAGFFYFANAWREDWIKRAHDIFQSTFIGIVIVLSSWLIVDVILHVFVGEGVRPFTDIQCVQQGSTISQDTSRDSSGVQVTGGDNSKASLYAEDYDSRDYYNEEFYGDDVDETFFEGFFYEDTSQQISRVFEDTTPPSLSSSQISSLANKVIPYAPDNCFYAQGGAPNQCAATLAIIAAESSGNPQAENSGHIGLMQTKISTAKGVDPGLRNLDDATARIQLFDPKTNMKVGNQYYAYLYNIYKDHDLATAAYNGGPGANEPSIDCPGLRRWQCGWDNPEHTIPNTGYAETRAYVSKVKTLREQLIAQSSPQESAVSTEGFQRVSFPSPSSSETDTSADSSSVYRWSAVANVTYASGAVGRTPVSAGPFLSQEECYAAIANPTAYVPNTEEVTFVSFYSDCEKPFE